MDNDGFLKFAAGFLCLATFLTGLLATYTLDARLREIQTVAESTNATLGEICARLDSLPADAKVWYFIPKKEK